jgi:lipoprotein-anchoring transpeptidase ErfK/SrfK
MPLVVRFSEPAKDEDARAALEERLVVETSKPVEGAWRWFGDDEVHYRPKKYWPAGTKITLRINTLGATNGDGAWGIREKVKTFRIGRSVVTRVDLKTKRMNVYVNGKLARTIPVTGGKKDWETRRGTKVILEKRRNINFRNQAIGAPEEYNLRAPYGLRVTWSGEFLHSAAWSVASQGKRNVSHGCIGMSVANSKWLWSISQVGDPAETVNTGGELMPVTGNGYGDWNLTWEDWKAGSALRLSSGTRKLIR